MDVVSVDALTRAVLDMNWPRASVLALVTAVAEAYATPPRAYHNLRHVEELLGWFAQVRDAGPGWQRPDDVLAALLFHDAIYEPLRSDNEARSAVFAGEQITALGLPCDAARVSVLIEATARHGAALPDGVEDADLAHFLDADMAILGALPARFDAYEQAIATEFAAVPADRFRAGRARFLQRVLALPRIYETEFFSSRLESAARANLTRASAALND